jgi:hypothetical protein
MELCSENHEEVCYKSVSYSSFQCAKCPVCEVAQEKQDEIDELKEVIEDGKNIISNLEKQLEEREQENDC